MYKNLLKGAVERTKSAGYLSNPGSAFTTKISHKKHLKLCDFIELLCNKHINENVLDRETFRLACLQMTTMAHDALFEIKHIKQRSLITIGDVYHRDKSLFNCDPESMVSELTGVTPSQTQSKFHAWLTIGDRIIDPTINPYLYPRQWISGEMSQEYVHWQKINDAGQQDFTYKPILCGKEAVLRFLEHNA